MPGNLTLPRLGTRGVAEPTGKQKREPKRYAVADRRQDGPAVETLRSPVRCEAIDLEGYSVPVRQVLFAARQPRATCKFVLGDPMSDFTYCGDQATVIVAGALTYCEACAKAIGWDRQAWQRAQDALRDLKAGMLP